MEKETTLRDSYEEALRDKAMAQSFIVERNLFSEFLKYRESIELNPADNEQPDGGLPVEKRRITVETVLSQESVNKLEYLLEWFWDETDWSGFTKKLMKILSVYVAHCPEDVHAFEKPDWIVENLAADLLKLNNDLVEIMNAERPWNWEYCDGCNFQLPADKNN